MYIYVHNTLISEYFVFSIMSVTQEVTETPDWTMQEELMCQKILKEVANNEVKIYKLR